MLSKKSYFNAVLYRKNLARFWPLWGGLSLAGSVVPLYMLLMLLSYGRSYVSERSVAGAIYSVVSIFGPGGLMVYAALCGVLCWGYLSNSRSVGLYHTLPVSRTCLFLTTLASGLTMMLLPCVIVGALSCLVLLCYGALPVGAVLWAAVLVIGMCLLFFSLITLTAMLSGNSFAILAFYFLGNFLAAALEVLLNTFSQGFLFGVTSSYTGRVEFLSPVIFLYRNLWVRYGMDDGPNGVCIEGSWVVGVYALVGIAILALSLVLYHRRKSESAGDVVAQNWLKPIFRYGVAILSALTLGQLLYELVYNIPFGGGRYKNIVPMAVCMIITAILGYYVASMLLKKSLRVFRGSWQGPVTTAAMVIILCGCVSFDIFGSASYVPDLEDVEDITIMFMDQNIDAAGDSELAQLVTELHRAIVEDEAYIRDMTQYGMATISSTSESDENDTTQEYLYLRYEMKDGRTVRREYTLPLVRDRWYNQPDTFDYLLRKTVFGPEAAIAAVTPVHDGTLENLYVEYWDNNTGEYDSLSLSGEAAQKVYDAVLADVAAGSFYSDDIFDFDAYYGVDFRGSMEFSFRYWSEEEKSSVAESVRIDFTRDLPNTIQALQELAPNWFEQTMGPALEASVSLGNAIMAS